MRLQKENDSALVEKLRSLGVYRPEDWKHGAYPARVIDGSEKRLGRAFDGEHRTVLERLGGNFLFETGAARTPGGNHDVVAFFGLGDPYDIVELQTGYRGQIPQGWYPFAKDAMGHIYCVADDDAIQYVQLQEDQWARKERPETSGERIASSFVEFVMSLQIPDWAVAYLEEQSQRR